MCNGFTNNESTYSVSNGLVEGRGIFHDEVYQKFHNFM